MQNFGARILPSASATGEVAIAVCWTATVELKALGNRAEEGINVIFNTTVTPLHKRLEEIKIDILINIS